MISSKLVVFADLLNGFSLSTEFILFILKKIKTRQI